MNDEFEKTVYDAHHSPITSAMDQDVELIQRPSERDTANTKGASDTKR